MSRFERPVATAEAVPRRCCLTGLGEVPLRTP